MLKIKSAKNKDIPALSSFCKNSVLGTKIMCQINAYGLERDFLSVWCCTNEDETILAVICKFEDSMTLVSRAEDNSDDIRIFLDMIGFGSLCCSYETAVKLNYTDFTTKKAYIYKGKYDGEVFGELTEDCYKDCYSFICKNIPDSFADTKEAYLSFLSDFTYRKRRGLARIKGFAEKGVTYSCALTSAETNSSAIISGVACDASYRKSGLGKKTVLSVAEELKSENRNVYVIALNESAEGFYEHIGFEFTENISFIERK